MSAIQAIHQLLQEGGLAIVTCHVSAWGLIHFCDACRLAGFGVDWRLCCFNQHQSGKHGDWYFILRKGMPHLTNNSYEDARAFLKLRPIVDGMAPAPEIVDRCDLSLQSESLLVDGSGVSTSGQRQRIRLWEHDGTLIASVDGLDGEPYSLRGDFSQLCDLLDVIQERLVEWQSGGRRLKSWFEHPTLKRFREFCNQHLVQPQG